MTQYIINLGVPQEAIVLLLLLPVVLTIVAFFRQVIGMKGLDISTPLIISFVFLATGLQYGLILFVAILTVGTAARFVIRRFRLLYLPRMALTITMISLAVLALAIGEAYLSRPGIIISPILAIMILIMLAEKFLVCQIQRGEKRAFLITLETLVVAVACFLVMNLLWVQNFTLTYPLWVILGSIAANILLGRWTGLRFSEYIKFWDVIRQQDK